MGTPWSSDEIGDDTGTSTDRATTMKLFNLDNVSLSKMTEFAPFVVLMIQEVMHRLCEREKNIEHILYSDIAVIGREGGKPDVG